MLVTLSYGLDGFNAFAQQYSATQAVIMRTTEDTTDVFRSHQDHTWQCWVGKDT